MDPILELSAVVKVYQRGAGVVDALRGVDLAVKAGELVVIAGPTQCGKSTLLRLAAGLELPTIGVVRAFGAITARLDENRLAQLRRDRIGAALSAHDLIDLLSVEENVELPLALQGEMSRAERNWRVADTLDLFGALDLRRRMPLELDLDQRRRVLLARALVTQPELVIADEPTDDLANARPVIEAIRRLIQQLSITFLCAGHDTRLHDRADRLVRLDTGRVAGDLKRPPVKRPLWRAMAVG